MSKTADAIGDPELMLVWHPWKNDGEPLPLWAMQPRTNDESERAVATLRTWYQDASASIYLFGLIGPRRWRLLKQWHTTHFAKLRANYYRFNCSRTPPTMCKVDRSAHFAPTLTEKVE